MRSSKAGVPVVIRRVQDEAQVLTELLPDLRTTAIELASVLRSFTAVPTKRKDD
jgi:hypothetical protein